MRGDSQAAARYYQQHLDIARVVSDKSGEGNALWNLSLALFGLGRRASAIASAEEALRIYQETGSPHQAKVRERLSQWRSLDGV